MVMNTLLKLADDEDSERLSQEEKVSIIQKVIIIESVRLELMLPIIGDYRR